MNLIALLITPLLAFPTVALATWFNEHNIDKFDRVETHRAWGFGSLIGNEFTTYGIRCDNRNKLLITLGFATELDERNAKIDVIFKIDQHDPLTLEGQLFSNSTKEGFVRVTKHNMALVNQVVMQSKQGHAIHIRASNKQQSQFIEYSVPLIGFTRFSHSTREACGIGVTRLEMTPQDKATLSELKQKLSEIKQEIAELEAKYSAGF
ncbi:hypothetical protein [Vibrio cionasavignyae]|uniref:hypothetical protein n=1 Tax=Vibrio cionasavignyae TaxID=2910252 RepID=UPI003D149B1B